MNFKNNFLKNKSPNKSKRLVQASANTGLTNLSSSLGGLSGMLSEDCTPKGPRGFDKISFADSRLEVGGEEVLFLLAIALNTDCNVKSIVRPFCRLDFCLDAQVV